MKKMKKMKTMKTMKTMKGMSGGLLVALPGAIALFQGEVASSAVVFSGVLNHQVPVTAQGTVVNFATGVVVNGAASGVPGWDINPYGTSGTNVALLAGSGTGIMRNPDAGTNTFRTYLPVGTVVGASAFFYGNSAAAMGTAVGQWAPNSEGYIGVRFLNEASSTPTTHYGFIHMRIGATATDRTIIGFGWETTANTAITTIPVPAPAAGLLALAAGCGIRRRRR